MSELRLNRGPVILLATLAICYVAFFQNTSALGLLGPDEPRYASVARAMEESGDWVTPRLNGKPWFEKPVLYYWLAGAAFRIFGVGEFSARLPSAFFATVAVLTCVWMALRLFGWPAAWSVAAALPTCVGMIGFARAATADMMFSALLMLSLATAHRTLEKNGVWGGELLKPRADWPWLAMLGAAIGLATLAKGPAAIVLAGGSTLLWAGFSRAWRAAVRLLHPIAVAAFCVVAIPWYALCSMRNPEFVQVFLFSHNVERFLTPVFQHQQPFWFFGPILLLGLAPWTILLAAVMPFAVRLFPRNTSRVSQETLLVCWVLFPILFFSISKSKLPGYILPVIPPLVLLCARALILSAEKGERAARWLVAGVGVTLIGLAASAGHWLAKLPADALPTSHREFLVLSIATSIAGLAVAVLSFLSFKRVALAAVCVAVLGLMFYATRFILPTVDSSLSSRKAAQDFQSFRKQAATFKLHRNVQYGLEYYWKRELPEWHPGTPLPNVLLTSPAGWQELASGGIQAKEKKEVSSQLWIVRTAPDSPSESERQRPGD